MSSENQTNLELFVNMKSLNEFTRDVDNKPIWR